MCLCSLHVVRTKKRARLAWAPVLTSTAGDDNAIRCGCPSPGPILASLPCRLACREGKALLFLEYSTAAMCVSQGRVPYG